MKRIRAALAAAAMVCAAPAVAQTFTVEPAPGWDALFDRNSGWTGADGIYSIPLSGEEVPGARERTDTLFVFSDTFIGGVTEDGGRTANTTLVNNTVGGGLAGQDGVVLHYSSDAEGNPVSSFVPTVASAAPDEWYWMKDGIVLDGTVYLFAARFRRDPVEFVYREGLSVIAMPEDSRPPFADHVQAELPLALPPEGDRGAVVFGAGIMPNTKEAGAPAPDGHIYVYGTREDPLNKRVLVSRVPRDRFDDPNAWRFWDGGEWTTDIRAAAPVAGRASNELSVTPLPDGRYLMVFQLDQIGPQVAARIGKTPWGPFGDPIVLYTCPEQDAFRDVYCYNAKAHPHLSRPGELLVSYNVNTLQFDQHFRDADIYRPRFIRVSVGGL